MCGRCSRAAAALLPASSATPRGTATARCACFPASPAYQPPPLVIFPPCRRAVAVFDNLMHPDLDDVKDNFVVSSPWQG